MSKDHNTRTGIGYADRHPDLGGNSFAGKARPVQSDFEHARCEYNAVQLSAAKRSQRGDTSGDSAGADFGKAARRESFMVKRQKPQPVLKPTLSLSFGPDRTAFNQQWIDERLKARSYQRKRDRTR